MILKWNRPLLNRFQSRNSSNYESCSEVKIKLRVSYRWENKSCADETQHNSHLRYLMNATRDQTQHSQIRTTISSSVYCHDMFDCASRSSVCENDRCVCVSHSHYVWTQLICSAATRLNRTLWPFRTPNVMGSPSTRNVEWQKEGYNSSKCCSFITGGAQTVM